MCIFARKHHTRLLLPFRAGLKALDLIFFLLFVFLLSASGSSERVTSFIGVDGRIFNLVSMQSAAPAEKLHCCSQFKADHIVLPTQKSVKCMSQAWNTAGQELYNLKAAPLHVKILYCSRSERRIHPGLFIAEIVRQKKMALDVVNGILVYEKELFLSSICLDESIFLNLCEDKLVRCFIKGWNASGLDYWLLTKRAGLNCIGSPSLIGTGRRVRTPAATPTD